MTAKSDDMAASEFNITRIKEIQSMFPKGENLFVPGRCFIREGVVTKICRKGPKKRHFFLFDDVLVYGTPIKSNLLSQQTILQLSDMGVNSVCHYAPSVDLEFESAWEGLAKEVAFQINHTEKSFHAFAASDSDKENWVRNLTTHISRARETKENSPLAFSPVWLPDIASHTCMLCNTEFTIIKRKHHCRECGRVVCSACSSHEIDLMSMRLGLEPTDGKLERVCDRCFVLLQSVQRKDRGTSVKKPEVGKPRRPARPPSVFSGGMGGGAGPKKPPPPKPAPYASTKKAPVSVPPSDRSGKQKGSDESDISDASSDDTDATAAPVQHNSDFASLHYEFSPFYLKKQAEQAAQDHGGDGGTENRTPPEPYPAVVGEKTQSEPETQSLAAKKALFVDKLIEVKSVSPVAAPRKLRKGASEAVESTAENRNNAAGVCEEATTSTSTDSATMPHTPEATPPHPEAAPPHPEPTPLQPETTAPKPEAAPPQPETTAPKPEAAPPHPEPTPLQPETTAPKPEAAPPQPETTAPEPEAAPPQPETTAPEPEAAPPQPETTAPEPETRPPEPEPRPPEPELTCLHPKTTPPQLETQLTGTEDAAPEGSVTAQEETDSDSLVHAPPRRKRTSKFVEKETKAAPVSGSPPSQKAGEREEKREEKDDVKEESAAGWCRVAGESEGAQGGKTGSLSVQPQGAEEVVTRGVGNADTKEVNTRGVGNAETDEVNARGVRNADTEELPPGTMEGGGTVEEGGESVLESSNSLQQTVVDAEEVRTDVRDTAMQQGLSGAKEGEGQSLVEAKHPQDNQTQSSPAPKKARGRRNKFAS